MTAYSYIYSEDTDVPNRAANNKIMFVVGFLTYSVRQKANALCWVITQNVSDDLPQTLQIFVITVTSRRHVHFGFH